MDNIHIAQGLLPHFIKYSQDISLSDSEADRARELHCFFFVDNHDLISISIRDVENVKDLAKKSYTVDRLKQEYSGLPPYWTYKLLTGGKINE
jgi:hypothetical protein